VISHSVCSWTMRCAADIARATPAVRVGHRINSFNGLGSDQPGRLLA
jgi:hypothetical protein